MITLLSGLGYLTGNGIQLSGYRMGGKSVEMDIENEKQLILEFLRLSWDMGLLFAHTHKISSPRLLSHFHEFLINKLSFLNY